MTYDWDFGRWRNVNFTKSLSHYKATTGTFTVELTVTDSNGTSAGAILIID
jgi:PKD repeat protein